MKFKDLVAQEEAALAPSVNKKTLFERTKYYILFQDVIADLKEQLHPDEAITGYLPITNQKNSMTASAGPWGLSYANTPRGKAYVKEFKDTRGNRLFVFTNQRLIYLTVLEFIEEGRYFSYPYDKFQTITIKPYQVSLFKPKTVENPYWYLLDFQADKRIVTELLTKEDAAYFRKQWQQNDLTNTLPIEESVKRGSRFDFFVSNVDLGIKVQYWISMLLILVMILLVVLLVLGLALGFGPFGDLHSQSEVVTEVSSFWNAVCS